MIRQGGSTFQAGLLLALFALFVLSVQALSGAGTEVPGVCGGWDNWPLAGGDAASDPAARPRSEIPWLEPHPTSPPDQLLWSAALRVEHAEGAEQVSGYSIRQGIGSISSSGFTLGGDRFGVLSALQRTDGFVLELIGADPLPGEVLVDVHAERGNRLIRLSTCDSEQTIGAVGSRFNWPNARLDWQTAESSTIAILRPSEVHEADAAGRLSSPVRFEGVPARHDGGPFSIGVRLPEGNSAALSLMHAGGLRVIGGAVTQVERAPGADSRGNVWRVAIMPDGRRSVGIRWQGDAEAIVLGPPISARVLELPEHHSGLKRVTVQIEFSEPLATELRALSQRSLEVSGAVVRSVRRPLDRLDMLEVTVAPQSGSDVTIALSNAPTCASLTRPCLDDVMRLAEPLQVTISAAAVYLTFDDGPHPVYTPRILDVLAEYDARATFFVIGRSAQRFPELIERIVREGHTLANHTWNHDVLAGLSDEAFVATVTRAQDALGEHATPCLRPPKLVTDKDTRPRAAELGLRVVMATSGAEDWLLPGADVIARRIYAAARPDSIILLHDGGGNRTQTVEGLRIALQSLQGRNYAYEPICHPAQ